MKKILTIVLTLFAYIVALQAQETEYQPLVREGVKWVNEHKIEWGDHTDCDIYQYEFSGDTIINGIEYKKCYRYKNQNLNPDTDIVYAIMREQGHKVYAIVIDDPIFGFFYRDENGNEVDDYQFKNNYEALLFDFDDPDALYDELYYPRIGLSRFLSGVGFDSKINGDAFHPFTGIETNEEYFETYGLRQIEDQNGNIIYKGYAYEQSTYQPLVREGVRWHTAYIENPGVMESNYHYVDNKIEFRGDTILSGVTYKKCYMYETTSWTPEARLIGYAREAFGQVMIVSENEYWFVGDETYTIPGEYCDLTGERVIYDFSDMEGFVEGWGTHDKIVSVNTIPLGTKEVTRYVMTDGYNHRYYIVEGVGCDKPDHSVCPITPFSDPPTGNVSRWGGLIMLTNLDDEPLYKGSLYEKYRMQEYTDVNGDGKVDVSDVNEVINVVLGKSVVAADVNGDGVVDISDINMVINAMLGKIW